MINYFFQFILLDVNIFVVNIFILAPSNMDGGVVISAVCFAPTVI
jgi:hypothetical protein